MGFKLLDNFKFKGIDSLLTNPILPSEVRVLVKKFSPSTKLKLGKTQPIYFDMFENVISLNSEKLYEEIVMHELGHAVNSQMEGSANWLLMDELKSRNRYTKKMVIQAEEEAWNWAKDNSPSWGLKSRILAMKAIINYKYFSTASTMLD